MTVDILRWLALVHEEQLAAYSRTSPITIPHVDEERITLDSCT